jgi:hypothetical protein
MVQHTGAPALLVRASVLRLKHLEQRTCSLYLCIRMYVCMCECVCAYMCVCVCVLTLHTRAHMHILSLKLY